MAIVVQNFKKVKNIKISTPLHDELGTFKYLYKCTTFEELFRIMLDRAKAFEIKENSLKEREDVLKRIERDFKQKNDFIIKRLSSYELRYFTKISNLYSNHEVSVKEILHAIISIKSELIETEKDEKIYSNPAYIELKKQFDELWTENSNCQLALKNKEEKIRNISRLFERKSTLMTTNYEARISPQEYEKIFKD